MTAEARLWKLIEQRMEPGADTKAVDERIWDLFGEDWAIMFTDLAGFSRRVAEFGIIHFLQVIYEHRRLVEPVIEAHDGLIVKSEADSLLVLFKRTDQALACAIAMQHACKALSENRVPEEEVLLCIGIGFGHVLRVGESDVYGAEVNAASKLGEDTAKAGEILITTGARDELGEPPALRFEPIDAVAGCTQPFRVIYS
jgi:class 3 adenylate cyclase